jgi:Putative transposase DNA-binding domain
VGAINRDARLQTANAGVELARIDPRPTSWTCPECGTVANKTLTEREHRCNCGCRPEREFAAAMVVHFRAFGFWPGTGPDRQASGLPPSLVQKPPALDGGSSQQAGSHPFPCANRFAMVWQ